MMKSTKKCPLFSTISLAADGYYQAHYNKLFFRF